MAKKKKTLIRTFSAELLEPNRNSKSDKPKVKFSPRVHNSFSQLLLSQGEPSSTSQLYLLKLLISCSPSLALLQLHITTRISMNYSETTCVAILQMLRLAQETNLGKVFVGGLMNLDQCLPQTQPCYPFQQP